jgi:hypothetical protein
LRYLLDCHYCSAVDSPEFVYFAGENSNHLDSAQITAHLQSFAGVVAVHNLRFWTIALGQDAHLTANS